MKKNWVLRLGLLAMVLTLVTMPMVSSTYAKYVTSASATGTARVAQWGVVVDADFRYLFGDAYEFDTNAIDVWTQLQPDVAEISVNADSQYTMVFAPGTEGSFIFTLQGTPEVALNLDVVANIEPDANWQVNTIQYEPINFTFMNGTKYYDTSTSKFSSASAKYLSASQLEEAINNLDSATNIAANTNLVTSRSSYNDGSNTGEYRVDWIWPFEWSTAYKTWNAAMISTADVSNYYVETGVGTGVFVTAVNPYDPAVTYYTDDTGTTPVLHSAIVLAAYNQADTLLANGVLPELLIELSITATQIN